MQDQTRGVTDHRIAMLIDGDNAQPSLIQGMLTETGKYGVISIRRVYGDWTEANMKPWKNTLNLYAVQPIQQFRYTTGKNATDSAMIIDAMDLLYEGVANGFCLVSSDSDYTRLATRIREKGLFVMAIGRRDTPRAFVNACEVFIYTENLQPSRLRLSSHRRLSAEGLREPFVAQHLLPHPHPRILCLCSRAPTKWLRGRRLGLPGNAGQSATPA